MQSFEWASFPPQQATSQRCDPVSRSSEAAAQLHESVTAHKSRHGSAARAVQRTATIAEDGAAAGAIAGAVAGAEDDGLMDVIMGDATGIEAEEADMLHGAGQRQLQLYRVSTPLTYR